MVSSGIAGTIHENTHWRPPTAARNAFKTKYQQRTSVSRPMASAGPEVLGILREEDSRIVYMKQNANRIRKGKIQLGYLNDMTFAVQSTFSAEIAVVPNAWTFGGRSWASKAEYLFTKSGWPLREVGVWLKEMKSCITWQTRPKNDQIAGACSKFTTMSFSACFVF